MGEPLWLLSQNVLNLESRINELLESGEDDQTALDLALAEWSKANDNFQQKAIAVSKYIVYLEAIAEANKTEAKRYQERAGTFTKRAERLRKNLATEMSEQGKTEIKDDLSRILLTSSSSVEVLVTIDELPDELVRVTRVPDRSIIRKKLKLGECQDVAEIVQTPCVKIT